MNISTRVATALVAVVAVISTPQLGVHPVAVTSRPACSAAAPGHARCFAILRTDSQASSKSTRPAGYGPRDFASAYQLPSRTAGAGQTIAIVDAFDDPNAEVDLAVYRQTFHLQPCTTANGCFHKVNQRGESTNYPPPDPGWAVEISLDVQMVSAACPLCHILLVEADDSSFASLAAAEDTATASHVNAISNSYGGPEFYGMGGYASHYRHPGTAIVVASGDFGFGPVNFPAVLRDVIAVGGTSLSRSVSTRGWSEQAWLGSGSGCSAYVAKPLWQHDQHCHMRTVADISAVADPNTGVAIYDTYMEPGWGVAGGTSASAPLIAGMIGLAGNGSTVTSRDLYTHAADLWDVTGGSNGVCGGDYLCTAKRGYDGPTGMGTPHGVAEV